MTILYHSLSNLNNIGLIKNLLFKSILESVFNKLSPKFVYQNLALSPRFCFFNRPLMSDLQIFASCFFKFTSRLSYDRFLKIFVPDYSNFTSLMFSIILNFSASYYFDFTSIFFKVFLQINSGIFYVILFYFYFYSHIGFLMIESEISASYYFDCRSILF